MSRSTRQQSKQRPAGPARWAATLAAGGVLFALFGMTGMATAATSGAASDAGLLAPVQLPSPVTGRSLNVSHYGATPNSSANDDAAGFRAAIAAAVPGDEVYVPNGTYVFRTRQVELKTGVSLRGQSTTGTVIDAQFAYTDSLNKGSYIFGAKPGVNDLTLSNMRLLSNGGQALNYPVWLGSEQSGGVNVSRIAVRGLQIEKFYKMAISVRNGDNVTIENNIIKNASALGGGGEGYGVMIGYDDARNNRVAGNTIGPVIRHAILLQYRAHHNLIENNKAYGTTLDAYDLHGEDEYSNELRYNLAKDCDRAGFGLGNVGGTPEHYNSGPDNWIHHNEVSACRYGIHLYRLSHNQYIEDNYVHHSKEIALRIDGEGAQNILFARNRVQYNKYGANFARAAGLRFIGNTVTNNTYYALKTDTYTTGYEIRDNDFRYNGSNSVQLGSTNGIYTNNRR